MTRNSSDRIRATVIGGGTGTYIALDGLKKHLVDLRAVVSVTDSGGSTGRLRDEFGFLPVGDFRQCLAALAPTNGEVWIRDLLLYRFSKGEGLRGHNLGNLLLTALTDMTGSEAKAVETAGRIFQLRGRVLPVSQKNIQLTASYDDGSVVVGEHEIDESAPERASRRIVELGLQPEAEIYEPAAQAIIESDLVVIGPGDLYTSLLPNFLVEGAGEAVSQRQGRLVYILNLMTRKGQTHGYTARQHLDELVRYLGAKPDVVIVNNEDIPEDILAMYAESEEYPVVDDLGEGDGFEVVRGGLLADSVHHRPEGDVLTRSYLRHDSDKLANLLMAVVESQDEA